MEALKGFDIGNLTATGALIWVVWYTLSRGLPNIVEKLIADGAAARQQFLTSQEKLISDGATARTEYLAAEKDLRDSFREESQANRAAFTAALELYRRPGG